MHFPDRGRAGGLGHPRLGRQGHRGMSRVSSVMERGNVDVAVLSGLSLLGGVLLLLQSAVNFDASNFIAAGIVVVLLLLVMKHQRDDAKVFSEGLGDIKRDLATIAADLASAKDDIAQLQASDRGVGDRISQAMSKVASQMQTSLSTVQNRHEARMDLHDGKVWAMEQRVTDLTDRVADLTGRRGKKA